MQKYVVTQSQQIIIEAPNAAIARVLAEAGFKQKLHPANIRPGMSVSNIQNITIKVEKAD